MRRRLVTVIDGCRLPAATVSCLRNPGWGWYFVSEEESCSSKRHNISFAVFIHFRVLRQVKVMRNLLVWF